MSPFSWAESFDLTALLFGIGSLVTAVQWMRQWSPFWDSDVTPGDRQLAERVAFFLLVPLGVGFHELGHAIAVWWAGGQVVDFQWRVFWGYVTSTGNYSPFDRWWIALSGNLASLLIGGLPLLLFPLIRRQILGEILVFFARYQLIVTLIIYPLFSFAAPGFEGDWVEIYDFRVRPYAFVMLGIHIVFLFGLRRLDRNEWLDRWRQQFVANGPQK